MTGRALIVMGLIAMTAQYSSWIAAPKVSANPVRQRLVKIYEITPDGPPRTYWEAR